MGRSRRSKNYKQNMRNVDKRSEDYKTKAQLKKERKELKRQSQMEKKFLIGVYDNHRKDINILNYDLTQLGGKLVGSYSTEPIYGMYDLKEENNCIVKTNGNNSIKVEVWEVTQTIIDKIERSYNYYPDFEEIPQDYVKNEVLSPFGKITMYFTNVIQPENELIISGDWIEYLNYKKATGNKKENVL